MNSFKKAIVICLAVLFSVGLYGTAISGTTGYEKPEGDPPHGLAIQSDAQGVKLYGVVFVEFYNYDPENDIAGGARVVLRLRKSNTLNTFFTHVPGPIPDIAQNPALIQEIIHNGMAPDVLDKFFPGEELGITVKTLTEFDDVEANNIIVPDDPNDPGNPVKIKKDTYYLEGHENCANGVDNDNDGLVGIWDPDCAKITFIVVADIELAVK
ncbi:hypothetical protein ACFLZE_00640 [Thermodesulfobacteriota bacterium]